MITSQVQVVLACYYIFFLPFFLDFCCCSIFFHTIARAHVFLLRLWRRKTVETTTKLCFSKSFFLAFASDLDKKKVEDGKGKRSEVEQRWQTKEEKKYTEKSHCCRMHSTYTRRMCVCLCTVYARHLHKYKICTPFTRI